MDNNVLKFERNEDTKFYVEEMISFHKAVVRSIGIIFNGYTSDFNNRDIIKVKLVFFKELINVKRKTLEDFNHHVLESLNMMFLENGEIENIEILRRQVEDLQLKIEKGQEELFVQLSLIDDFIRLHYPSKEE
jgi:hypothetical protein